jgi:peptidoglycan/LPS O-acetylase OafA/YrhL
VWRRPALVRLGELSFAFYMVHILVLHAGSAILTTLPAPIGAATALTGSLTLSWLIYQGVERPARQLILRKPTGLLTRRKCSRPDHIQITNPRPAVQSRPVVSCDFVRLPAVRERAPRDARVTT